ncbi:hypothetical protein N8I77_007305 [Diaporthe amygdali]|uniref:Uncharacterized protein n=1 Tax=Phomopsis amygdali TaxID=1214568 RepID=A0AAD9SBR7_PHOAM|nr:hypothetical protein N8I77_007305 [Diaporthe amygdali]
MEEPPDLSTSQHSSHRSRITLARRTCICRKRVVRSRRALLWGPWQALADTSTTHDHFPDCIFHVQGAKVPSTRWSLAFKGLQGLINRAIEVSFSYSFGAGGCSLSPGFNYYPTVDRRRDPAFRIMGLFHWASLILRASESRRREFLEQCLENMGSLYRHSKASPKAVDQYGRSVLHYFHISLSSETQSSLLTGLDTLVKLGVQATMPDIYGSTPAWSMTCLGLGPWVWDSPWEGRSNGMDSTTPWYSYSLVTEFLCAQEPYQSIATKPVLNLPTSMQKTMELFCLMQRSPATAEGLYYLSFEP